MDKKRQTITLTRDFYNATKWMKDENRLEFYDTVFRSLFDNKSIDYEKIKSENVASALAILSPALSAITSKYENRVGKKLKSTPSPFLCSPSSIEMERNGTNLSEPATSYLNNKLNNNIYNIYTNKQTKEKTIKENKATTDRNTQPPKKQDDNGDQKINQTKTQDPCDFELTSENLNKAQFYCSVLQDKSECIADNFVKARFLELAQRLCQEQTPLKIKGVYTSPDEILNKYVSLFAGESDAINKKLIEIFSYFDDKVEQGTVKNTYKYLVSILYNIAREQVGSLESTPILQFPQKQPTTSYTDQEIMRHNYTKEQLNAIYDSLDNIEI